MALPSIDTLNVKKIIINTLRVILPPYDISGTGTPVSGINARIPPKLTMRCKSIIVNVPYAMREPVKSLAFFDIFNIF